MAVLMGAFIILGIQPGPAMMTSISALVWTLIWALVIGNLIAIAFLLVVMRWAAMLTFVNGAILVPFIIVLAVVGSYVNEGQWENLVVLVRSACRLRHAALQLAARAFRDRARARQGYRRNCCTRRSGFWGWQFFLRPLSLDPDRADRLHHRFRGLEDNRGQPSGCGRN